MLPLALKLYLLVEKVGDDIDGGEVDGDDDDGIFLGCNMIKNINPGINSNIPYWYHQ